MKDIILGKQRLPLENKKAMVFLQNKDQHLLRVRDLLKAGQTPSLKRDKQEVKLFFRQGMNTTIDKDRCLIVYKRD